MAFYIISQADCLSHHGIKGQRWGIRRFQKKDGTRTSRGKVRQNVIRKVNKDEEQNEHKGLTDNQKKWIKRGAIIGGVALAAVGGYALYKTGKLNPVIDKLGIKGKKAAKKLMAGETPEKIATGLIKKMKPESVSEALKNANQLSTEDAKNTCVPSAISGYLRTKGYNVTAKSTNGQMQNLAGVVEECFSGAKVLDGSAQTFGKSRQDAVNMIKKRFGDNCEGCVSCNLKGIDGSTNGHAFSFKVTDGKCEFMDYRHGRDDSTTSKYFNIIDTEGPLQLIRLDGSTVNEEGITKWCNSR